MTRVLIIILSLLPLAACKTTDLSKQTELTSAEAASGEVVCIDMADPVCAKSARIKARSCLELAQNAERAARTTSADARGNARCASSTFASIIAGGAPTEADYVGGMEAERLMRETSTSVAAGSSANQELTASAKDFSSAFPSRAAGPYYAADAAYWQAAFANGTGEACAHYVRAAGLAAQAASGERTPDFPDLRTSAETLALLISRDATAKGCS